MTKPHVEIEYCSQCGFLLRSAWMAQELLTTFVAELGGVTLKPGSGGIFEVRVDGCCCGQKNRKVVIRRQKNSNNDCAITSRRIRIWGIRIGVTRLSLNSANLSDHDPTYGEFTVRALAPSAGIPFDAHSLSRPLITLLVERSGDAPQ